MAAECRCLFVPKPPKVDFARTNLFATGATNKRGHEPSRWTEEFPPCGTWVATSETDPHRPVFGGGGVVLHGLCGMNAQPAPRDPSIAPTKALPQITIGCHACANNPPLPASHKDPNCSHAAHHANRNCAKPRAGIPRFKPTIPLEQSTIGRHVRGNRTATPTP